MQLLYEFNQDKINKIASAFAASASQYVYDVHYEYETDANWIKAAVEHMDHLRQNKMHFNRMLFIVQQYFPTVARRKFFANGDWDRIAYSSFLIVVNSFEPSVQMRRIQQQYEKVDAAEHQLQKKPVVVQDDDKFLVMRAETPDAAIEAAQIISQATKRQYSWCISTKNSNMFYKYRVEDKSSPVTAYFVYNKTKPVDDDWHAFVDRDNRFVTSLDRVTFSLTWL